MGWFGYHMCLMPDLFPMDEAGAREFDVRDPLRGARDLFHIPTPPPTSPRGEGVGDVLYFCGNSLGLQPRSVAGAMTAQLDDWAKLGVEGHFYGRDPWYVIHESLRGPFGRVLGARPHEVVVMNSLTVNLHLLMASFYRPTRERFRIVLDGPSFPSDVYAVKSQLRFHGYDPDEALVWVRPRDGEHTIREEDVEALLAREGAGIALMLMAGVNFVTGQWYDIERLTRAAHAQGCVVGWDCAHAVGNVPLRLHDWDVDFACWCTYKYLNSGAGAVGGAFVHERWVRELDSAAFRAMPRFEGWWGNDPDTRFQMGEAFEPVRSADAWQLSNPPMFAMVPIKCSLEIFDRFGIDALREKSVLLTGYLERLLDGVSQQVQSEGPGKPAAFEVITPREPGRRGCQLSIMIGGVDGEPRALFKKLSQAGVVCDFREPNVVRVAPTPLYNSFHDVWRFAQVFASAVRSI